MFGDQIYDAEGFDSTWKSEKDSCNESVQTTEFSTNDKHTSTAKSISVNTQTDNNEEETAGSVDMNKLSVWLKSVCPNMLNELKDMSLTNAMTSLKLNDNTQIVTANMLQQIDMLNETTENLYVSSLSWNSTGNTLAVSCSYNHETWCHHEGFINLYTFNRDDILPSTPTKTLITTACVTTLSFHPTHPSVLCAGTISGEIYLWNNQNEDGDNLVATLAGHDDRVTLISWIKNIDSKNHGAVLASAGLDSYLILWNVEIDDSVLSIKQKYTTGKINKSISSPEVYSKKSDGGIVHFDFSPHISGLFVLGMEGGTVIKCSIMGAKPLSSDGTTTGSILDPSINYYERHEGEISSLAFSPHRNDLFLSCGTDNEIKIFHIDQATPVQIIFMDVTLNSVSWITQEEKLLVGCGDNGSIRLYSLLNGQLIPNTTSNIGDPLYKLDVNKKRSNIAAFGNARGQLQLWSIPWNNIANQDSYNVYGKSK